MFILQSRYKEIVLISVHLYMIYNRESLLLEEG